MCRNIMSSSSTSISRRHVARTSCYCGLPAVVAQAWTAANPGRKFYTCQDYNPVTKTKGCRYFRWYDDRQTPWQREIILQIKAEIEDLEAEKALLGDELGRVRSGGMQYKFKAFNIRNNRYTCAGLAVGAVTTFMLILMVVIVVMK